MDLNSECNQFIGISRSGKNTKIHTVVDGIRKSLAIAKNYEYTWQQNISRQDIWL